MGRELRTLKDRVNEVTSWGNAEVILRATENAFAPCKHKAEVSLCFLCWHEYITSILKDTKNAN